MTILLRAAAHYADEFAANNAINATAMRTAQRCPLGICVFMTNPP